MQKIRRDLDSIPKDNHVQAELPHQNLVHNLTSFDQVSMDTIKKVITSTPSKTCALDPIPTTLLKHCIDELLPTLTNIVNMSLSTPCVPTSFKKATITPVIKKSNADPNLLKELPANLQPFLSFKADRAHCV